MLISNTFTGSNYIFPRQEELLINTLAKVPGIEVKLTQLGTAQQLDITVPDETEAKDIFALGLLVGTLLEH